MASWEDASASEKFALAKEKFAAYGKGQESKAKELKEHDVHLTSLLTQVKEQAMKKRPGVIGRILTYLHENPTCIESKCILNYWHWILQQKDEEIMSFYALVLTYVLSHVSTTVVHAMPLEMLAFLSTQLKLGKKKNSVEMWKNAKRALGQEEWAREWNEGDLWSQMSSRHIALLSLVNIVTSMTALEQEENRQASAFVMHWKSTLRQVHGIQDVVKQIDRCATFMVEDRIIDPIDRMELLHSLHVLEHTSFMDEEIKSCLAIETTLVSSLMKMLQCTSALLWGKAKTTISKENFISEIFIATLRVLMNITNGNDDACDKLYGEGGTQMLVTVFDRISTTQITEPRLQYDAELLALSSLANTVEHHSENRHLLSEMKINNVAFPVKLVQYFLTSIQPFKLQLCSTTDELSQPNTVSWKPEDLVLAGTCALLIGCLLRDHASCAAHVLHTIPGHSPAILSKILQAFVALHTQMGALSQHVLDSVLEVMASFKQLEVLVNEQQLEECTFMKLHSVVKTIMPEGSPHRRPRPERVNTPKQSKIIKRVTTPPASAFRNSPLKKVRVDLDAEEVLEQLDLSKPKMVSPKAKKIVKEPKIRKKPKEPKNVFDFDSESEEDSSESEEEIKKSSSPVRKKKQKIIITPKKVIPKKIIPTPSIDVFEFESD